MADERWVLFVFRADGSVITRPMLGRGRAGFAPRSPLELRRLELARARGEVLELRAPELYAPEILELERRAAELLEVLEDVAATSWVRAYEARPELARAWLLEELAS